MRKYLLPLCKRGGVVNATVTNATAKALISNYYHVVGQVGVDSSRWEKNLFFSGRILSSGGKHRQRWTFLMGL